MDSRSESAVEQATAPVGELARKEIDARLPVVVVTVAVTAGIATIVLSWLGFFTVLGEWLSDSSSPVGVIVGLVVVILALSPFAMWFFYRQFVAAQLVLSQLAGIDTLTGLPNRLGLTERLDAAIAATAGTNTGVAVLFVDLDRFKVVNDTFGHELGDALMVQVARRLREAVRPGDEVCRYGGDEFVVTCNSIGSDVAAKQIAQRIIDGLTVSYATGTQTLNISCSIGISFTDADGPGARACLRDADVAMYQAKSAGPGAYRIYDHILGKALTPSAIEARLRTAVVNHEFCVYYQPVVATDTGTILGTEALLRWEDPERGLLEPAEFLPLLEETGLIVPVGTWVLQEACRQLAQWRALAPDRTLEMKVNVSARQLGQADFADLIRNALNVNQLDPSALVLEITESALMDDVSSAWTMLRTAKASGVQLALDDFGTGFSSLSYIRQFSLDMLKIDRSFVSGIVLASEDHAIVEHIIGLAGALGMTTVAEGVEEAAQLRALQLLGCHRSQGFWFSPPVPAETIAAMLNDPTLPERWSQVADQAEPEPAEPAPRGLPNPLGDALATVTIENSLATALSAETPHLPLIAAPPRPVRNVATPVVPMAPPPVASPAVAPSGEAAERGENAPTIREKGPDAHSAPARFRPSAPPPAPRRPQATSDQVAVPTSLPRLKVFVPPPIAPQRRA